MESFLLKRIASLLLSSVQRSAFFKMASDKMRRLEVVIEVIVERSRCCAYQLQCNKKSWIDGIQGKSIEKKKITIEKLDEETLLALWEDEDFDKEIETADAVYTEIKAKIIEINMFFGNSLNTR